MRTGSLESVILFVSDLAQARAFYVGALGLPVLYEEQTIGGAGGAGGSVVLPRNDKGHDERGIIPAGTGVGGAAVRFTVDDPDACGGEPFDLGLTVVWPHKYPTAAPPLCPQRCRPPAPNGP